MNITTATISHQGSRDSNQDLTGAIVGSRAACFVVCDGIAGTPGGEIAAQLACDTILEHFDGECHFDAQSLRERIRQANTVIQQNQKSLKTYSKMGTTLVSLFIDRDFQLAYWAHAGDSRLYLFRRGKLHSVTADHSMAQQMLDAGLDDSPVNNNLLYFALGVPRERDATSYSDILQLEDGDIFLLCTDGFWHNVTPQALEQTLLLAGSPQEWFDLLQPTWADAASDNYSAIAIWIGSPQETTRCHSLPDARHFLPPRQRQESP
ncbi:PP2C family protein-serine/threonine phosphatase [Entomohabitans teleogrylli]|uniref:PP2C family protein-serine/threonine phosphatase n=1 Tax=Entomohabitans teleogrylli TaxID=1384589 RepID=UPI00073D3BF8|nr:protein phosphatase 2C domain-containing protein [Entomohabitans teleogrylli]